MLAAAIALGAALLLASPGAAAEPPERITAGVLADLCASGTRHEREGCTAYLVGAMQATSFWAQATGADACRHGASHEDWLAMAGALAVHLRIAGAEIADTDAAPVIAYLYMSHFACPGDGEQLP